VHTARVKEFLSVRRGTRFIQQFFSARRGTRVVQRCR